MSEKLKDFPNARTAAERQARIDLAASLRLAVMNGFHEGIDNHFTLAVPGKTNRFYLNPYSLHWSEVRASDLLEVDETGEITEGNGIADRTAVCIHAPVHARGHACVLHTHMPYATALTQLEDMTLEMIGQNALGFAGQVAYDYEYGGLALDMDEGERMADIMGDKIVLMLANHGVVVCGKSVADAFHSLYFLERACQTQLYAMSTGRKMKQVPAAIVEKTRAQMTKPDLVPGELRYYDHHFAALKRMLDRREPDYAE